MHCSACICAARSRKHAKEMYGDTYDGPAPQKSETFKWTAGTAITWMLHCLGLLGQFVVGEHLEDPVWKCYVKHVSYLSGFMGSSFSQGGIRLLSKMQFEHMDMWLAIPMMAPFWKPKNHFSGHVLPIVWSRTGEPDPAN